MLCTCNNSSVHTHTYIYNASPFCKQCMFCPVLTVSGSIYASFLHTLYLFIFIPLIFDSSGTLRKVCSPTVSSSVCASFLHTLLFLFLWSLTLVEPLERFIFPFDHCHCVQLLFCFPVGIPGFLLFGFFIQSVEAKRKKQQQQASNWLSRYYI